MILRELQRHAVDTVKRHALVLSRHSTRAQATILTEYLWTEEGAESMALHQVTPAAPAWVVKLIDRQLEDERRHSVLLRRRLRELGVGSIRPAPPVVRAKLWAFQRGCAPFVTAFAAGPVVVLLAVAAQLEATGVRVFGRHLAVLEAEERAAGRLDPTAVMLRSILADEERHAKSCAAAVERLIRADERAALAAVRARIATIDRAFGVTIAVGFWAVIASRVVRDRPRSIVSPAVVAERRAA